ncbi:MAG: hypothetical protein MUD11_01740 [Rhodobacteraceae bacterium]|jgi:hypothetical protein|nr:hypothetical protein [Paracoccaceae bacterium]
MRLTVACLILAGCTYANVAATPIELADGTEAYRYTGRANFGYQLEEADRVMAKTCSAMGLRPVVLQQDVRTIGTGSLITTGAVDIGANQQQDLIFRCK